MVSIYKPAKGRKKPVSHNKMKQGSSTADTITIDTLDWQGKGVAKGKTMYFVDGALPGETCSVEVTSQKKNTVTGIGRNLDNESSARTQPFCKHAQVCGGCQLQHIDPDVALTLRDEALKNSLSRQLSGIEEAWEAPLSGERPAYRRKARLAIDARNSSKVKIGFRQQRGRDVVDIDTCPVLVPQLAKLITPLKSVIKQLNAGKFLGHISLIAGYEVEQITLKLTKSVPRGLFELLVEFAQENKVNLLIEDVKGEFRTLHSETEMKVPTAGGYYLHPNPNNFIQVNHTVNLSMIEQALKWLSPRQNERIADWFCGLGNFTLPLAATGATISAVEGVAEMVQRGKEYALSQGLNNIEWQHLDLSDKTSTTTALRTGFDKVLIDPSREGALTVCHALVEEKVERVVYISCNPSTFARDAKVLIEGGYTLQKAKAVEMFPYTHHMEMMALFTG